MTSATRPCHAVLALALAALGTVACGATPVPSDCWIALRAEYRLVPPAGQQLRPEDLSAAAQVIAARIARYGLALFRVQPAAEDRIAIDLPIQAEPANLREIIAPTGRMDLVPIPADLPAVQPGDQIPSGLPPLFGGDQFQSVRPSSDVQGLPALEFELKPRGAQAMAEYTRLNIGNQFAIVLDGEILSAPTVNAPIEDGRGLISGAFSEEEVNRHAALLAVGPLPMDIEEVSFGQVQPPAGCR